MELKCNSKKYRISARTQAVTNPNPQVSIVQYILLPIHLNELLFQKKKKNLHSRLAWQTNHLKKASKQSTDVYTITQRSGKPLWWQVKAEPEYRKPTSSQEIDVKLQFEMQESRLRWITGWVYGARSDRMSWLCIHQQPDMAKMPMYNWLLPRCSDQTIRTIKLGCLRK